MRLPLKWAEDAPDLLIPQAKRERLAQEYADLDDRHVHTLGEQVAVDKPVVSQARQAVDGLVTLVLRHLAVDRLEAIPGVAELLGDVVSVINRARGDECASAVSVLFVVRHRAAGHGRRVAQLRQRAIIIIASCALDPRCINRRGRVDNSGGEIPLLGEFCGGRAENHFVKQFTQSATIAALRRRGDAELPRIRRCVENLAVCIGRRVVRLVRDDKVESTHRAARDRLDHADLNW